MKKIYTLFLSVSATLALHAQPTMTGVNEAAVGLTFTYSYCDTASAQPGAAGANQTWDFSSAIADGSYHTDQWVDPATTPYAANFPGANLVQQTSDTSGNTVYNYHIATSAQTELLGNAFTVISNPIILNYTDTWILRQFPATYNSLLTETLAGSYTYSMPPLTISSYRTGTYETLMDGYGTLITPVATYSNVLRQKITQHLIDSNVYVGLPIPAQIIHSTSTSYFWGSTDAGNRLYQFYIGYDTTSSSAGAFGLKSVSYLGTLTKVMDTPPFESSLAVTYPNPSNDHVFIKLSNSVDGEAELFLYNSEGSVVKHITTRMKAAKRFEWMFPVSDLSTGVYHARIICAGKQWNSRLAVSTLKKF